MRFAWVFVLLLAGCISRTVEPIDTRPPKPKPKADPPKPPPSVEEPVVRIRVPTIDDCCAPLLARELRSLPGVVRVDHPELTLFVIERDPMVASNEAILQFLRKQWEPGSVDLGEGGGKEGK
jgi:hypothetical protein